METNYQKTVKQAQAVCNEILHDGMARGQGGAYFNLNGVSYSVSISVVNAKRTARDTHYRTSWRKDGKPYSAELVAAEIS